VAFFEGRYQVVAAGEMNLAKDASAYIMDHLSSRKNLIWLKQLNHQADFIAVGESEPVFHPLFTAETVNVTEPMNYSSLEKYFQSLPLSYNY
jgi:hypothetical protein